MGETFQKRISALLLSNRRHARYLAVLVCSALVVALGVTATLMRPGQAKTHEETVLDCQYSGNGAHTHDASCYDADGNLVCPLEEREYHVHDDSCYASETYLVCGLEEGEGAHAHDDSCYDEEGNLVCGLEESAGHVHDDSCWQTDTYLACGKDEVTETHTHGDGCFKTIVVEDEEPEPAAAEAEAETEAAADATDEAKADDAAKAATDAKAEEAMPEQSFKEDLKAIDENGNEYVLLTVSTKAPKGALPEGSTMKIKAVDEDAIADKVDEAVKAKAGENAVVKSMTAVDISFLDKDGAEVEPAKKVEVKITSAVVRGIEQPVLVHIDKDEAKSAEIMAEVAKVNADEKDTTTGNEDTLKFDTDKFSKYAITEVEIVEPVDPEVAAAMPEQSFTESAGDVTVVAKAPVGAFPEGTTMTVAAVDAEEIIDTVAGTVEGTVAQVAAVDITFLDAEGNQVQPLVPISVTMTSASAPAKGDPIVVHVDDEGEASVVKQTLITSSGDEVVFDAESFSVYVMVTTSLEQTLKGSDGNDYTITVQIPEEAGVPAGAELGVREILEGTEEYAGYLASSKEALDNGGAAPEADGPETGDKEALPEEGEDKKAGEIAFARFFDISILVNGEPFEPLAPVQVSVSYDDAVKVDENQQISAVHFASTGTEVISVDVEQNDEGVTEVTFEQGSFSVTGTVVQYLSEGWPSAGDYVIVVKPNNSNNYYAVKNNGQITTVNYSSSTGKVTFPDLTSVSQVSDYWWTVANAGYGWRNVSSGSNYLDPNVASAVSPSQDSVARSGGSIYNYYTTGSGWSQQTVYTYLTVDEEQLVVKGQGSSNADDRAIVFFARDFVVDEVPEPSEDDTDLGAPSTSKTLTSNDDGTYNLALSVTGKSQAKEEHSTADILVIFDTSGSMTSTRMTQATNAMDSLAEALMGNNTSAHPDTVRMKLLPFASVTREKHRGTQSSTYYNDFPWVTGTNGYSTFVSHLNELADAGEGGTNWQDAFLDAADVEMRSDADKYVIFVSDGNPTFRNDRWNNSWNDYNSTYYNRYGVWGTGDDSNNTTVSHCYQAARVAAKALVDSGMNFYTIGVFDDGIDRMDHLTAYAYSGSDSGSYPTGHYQKAKNETALKEAFANIINDIQKNFTYTGVTIEDGITALTATALVSGTVDNFTYKLTYVDAVDGQKHEVPITVNDDGTITVPSVKYNVEKATGGTEEITTAATTITGAQYDGNEVTWPIKKSDGSNYKLEKDWTYEVSFTVWPKQRAYDIVADLANGNITYDSLSDTEKQSIDRASLSLNTNTSAAVKYSQITTINGQDQPPVAKPDVTIENPPGVPLIGTDMKISKKWNDSLDPAQLLELLTEHLNADKTAVEYTVKLDVTQDKGTASEARVYTHDYPDGFIYSPQVTIEGGEVTSAVWPSIDIAIAPGIMVSEAQAKAHGIDKITPPYRTVTIDNIEGYNGTFYVIESGHRYEIVEDDTDYHFSMTTDVDCPMIIDGTLKNVILNEAGTEVTDITPSDGHLTELVATNNLRGRLYVQKAVEVEDGAQGVDLKSTTFKVKVKLTADGQAVVSPSGDKIEGPLYRIEYGQNHPETDEGWQPWSDQYQNCGRSGQKPIVNGVIEESIYAGDKIYVGNLPDGTVYEIEESDLPDGWELKGINVDASVVTRDGKVEDNKRDDVTVTNKCGATNVLLKKVDDKGAILGEATFDLTRKSGENWVSVATGITPGDTAQTNPVDLGKLAAGTYRLTETSAPAGYNIISSKYVEFEVFKDGDALMVRVAQGTDASIAKVETDASGKYVVVIANTPGAELPMTGGPGTTLFTITGSAVLAMAVTYGIASRRRRERGLD